MSIDLSEYTNPKIIASVGKGGTGKTTIACALAFYLASQGYKTAIFDCNKKGIGIARGFSPEEKIIAQEYTVPEKLFSLGIKNLNGGALSRYTFNSLHPMDDKSSRTSRKSRDEEFKDYMKQFPGPYSMIPFNDLLATFFGAFTSPQQAADFITLSQLYQQSLKNTQYIILDMKASDDFSEMFLNSVKAAHSLENMARLGFIHLQAVQKVLRMPDMKRYLQTKFVRECWEIYCPQFREASSALVKSKFLLSSGAEQEKVDEMFGEIQPLVDEIEQQRREVLAYLKTEIEVRNWEKEGKKGRRPKILQANKISTQENTLAYLANNIPTSFNDKDEEESTKRQAERVRSAAEKRGVKFLVIPHDKRLGGWDNCPDSERREALFNLGRKLTLDLRLE